MYSWDFLKSPKNNKPTEVIEKYKKIQIKYKQNFILCVLISYSVNPVVISFFLDSPTCNPKNGIRKFVL